MSGDTAEFKGVKCIAESNSGKSLLCIVEEKKVWIAKSLIHDDSEVYAKGHEGKLIISRMARDRERTRMTTRVVNLHREPFNVYIGRGGRGHSGYYGNPYVLGKDGTRTEVLEKYHAYFIERLSKDPEFEKRIRSLRGKVLGCFCAPQPCHGDVIIQWLEANP